MTSELTEGDYERIKETLMLRICERARNNNGVVELEYIRDRFNGWQDKGVVEEAIMRCESEKDFYQVKNKIIVLSETGKSECNKEKPGFEPRQN